MLEQFVELGVLDESEQTFGERTSRARHRRRLVELFARAARVVFAAAATGVGALGSRVVEAERHVEVGLHASVVHDERHSLDPRLRVAWSLGERSLQLTVAVGELGECVCVEDIDLFEARSSRRGETPATRRSEQSVAVQVALRSHVLDKCVELRGSEVRAAHGEHEVTQVEQRVQKRGEPIVGAVERRVELERVAEELGEVDERMMMMMR